MNQEINAVRHAVNLSGGATKTALTIQASPWSIHHWIKLGRVPNYSKASKLAELSGVPMDQLWQSRPEIGSTRMETDND